MQESGVELPMVFEPTQIGDFLPIRLFGIAILESVRSVGFLTPPGGDIGSDMHILEAHTYCCQLGFDVCSATGEPPAKMASECDGWHEKKVSTRAADAARLGVPLYMGEFGACGNSPECVTEIKQVLDKMDTYLGGGWSYWMFKTFADFTTSAGDIAEGFYNFDGTLQLDKVRMIARPYVKAAQGRITSVQVEEDWSLAAEVLVDAKISAPTIVHIYRGGKGQPIFGNDFQFTLGGPAGTDSRTKTEIIGNELQIFVKNPAMTGEQLTITVSAP